jgi:hypothetical protein
MTLQDMAGMIDGAEHDLARYRQQQESEESQRDYELYLISQLKDELDRDYLARRLGLIDYLNGYKE